MWLCRRPRRRWSRGTFPGKQLSRFCPKLQVDTTGTVGVSHGGGTLITEAVAATGLDRALSAALVRWRKPRAVHDQAKVITELAIGVVLGGECLADLAVLRAEPEVYGLMASDPTVSRTIAALAEDAPAALRAINATRAEARRECLAAGRQAGRTPAAAGTGH